MTHYIHDRTQARRPRHYWPLMLFVVVLGIIVLALTGQKWVAIAFTAGMLMYAHAVLMEGR